MHMRVGRSGSHDPIFFRASLFFPPNLQTMMWSYLAEWSSGSLMNSAKQYL
jgi:hypothetical protein